MLSMGAVVDGRISTLVNVGQEKSQRAQQISMAYNISVQTSDEQTAQLVRITKDGAQTKASTVTIAFSPANRNTTASQGAQLTIG